MSADMKRSWLVQRLTVRKQTSPFAFGGGYLNGGLNKEAMALLSQCFGFDYMGAAEFEFGAVPRALQGLADDRADLVADVVPVPLNTVPGNWRLPKGTPAPEGDRYVYLICRRQHLAEVQARVLTWAQDKADMKERTRMSAALRPHDKWDAEIGGWLELDNGFFAFTDTQMWASVCNLFGVSSEVTA